MTRQPETKNPPVVLVIGAGRTGTSAIAGSLHAAGISMGNDLIEPHKDLNPWGHFESTQFHRLERELCLQMADQGKIPRPWTDYLIYDWTSFATLQPDDHTQRELARYFELRLAEQKPLGLKSTLFPFIYQEVVDALSPRETIRVVCVHRNYLDSVKSRVRHMYGARDGKKLVNWVSAERVQSSMLAALHAFIALNPAQLEIFHVDFDLVLDNPKSELSALFDRIDPNQEMGLDYAAGIGHIRTR